MSPRILPNLQGKTYAQIRWTIDKLPVKVKTTHLPPNTFGLYDESQQLILIDVGLTYAQKRCTIAHELIHWRYGDQINQNMQHGSKQERRARARTPHMLFTDTEYQSAELLYDGDVYEIAQELNVTPKVVVDYQQLALPTLLLQDKQNKTIYT